MALDPSIPLQAKAPDFNPLATLMQVQQYKNQQQVGNRLQMDTDSNQAVSRAIQANTGDDGTVNLLAVQRQLAGDPAAAYNLQGTTGTNLAQQGQQISNETAQVQQQGAKLGLSSEQQAHLVQHMGTVLGKKDLSYGDAASAALQAGQMYGLPPEVIKQAVTNMPTDPAQLKSYLQSRLAGMQAPGAQLSTMTPNPTATNDGAKTTFRDTNAITNPGIVGTTYDQKLGPGQQETIKPDALGNQYIEQRDAHGAIVGTRAVPGGYNALGGVQGAGPAHLPPGGVGAIDDAQKEVSAARAAANQAPVLHDLNRSIIAEVDKGANTGQLGALTQKLASATGYNLGSEKATDYNVLGKLLERQALTAAQGMGPHTNAGLDAQVRANGSLDYTPQAIRKIAVLNDALTSGVEHYREGMEQALQASGQNPTVKRSFDQAWAQNFDPRIMRLQNASQRGDQAEIANVLKEVGGANSKGAKDLATKAQRLNQLISQGHL